MNLSCSESFFPGFSPAVSILFGYSDGDGFLYRRLDKTRQRAIIQIRFINHILIKQHVDETSSLCGIVQREA